MTFVACRYFPTWVGLGDGILRVVKALAARSRG